MDPEENKPKVPPEMPPEGSIEPVQRIQNPYRSETIAHSAPVETRPVDSQATPIVPTDAALREYAESKQLRSTDPTGQLIRGADAANEPSEVFRPIADDVNKKIKNITSE